MMRTLALSAVLLMTALAGCSGTDTSSSTSATGTEPTATATTGPATITSVTTQVQTTTATRTTTATVTPTTSTSTPPPTEAPSAAPIVQSLAVNGITANTATVTWNVTDDQAKVTSRVEYGPDPPANFGTRGPSHEGSSDFAEVLNSLASCTDYRVRVFAADPSGNSVYSGQMPFRTLGSAPTIGGITVTGVSHNRFSVSWTITGAADTKSHVSYGLTTALEDSTAYYNGPGTHTAPILNLESDRDYHFKVFASSPCGSTSSADTVQRTGMLVTITIRNNGGSINSFDKGSTLYGPAAVAKDRPITFKIKNADDEVHTWEIAGKAHSSPSIPVGGEHTFAAPISLAASGSPYTMRCTIHTTMTGTIEAS